MKRIVCEMCEGTEFVKENGFFVCQMCGTKYSLDEAKKMMENCVGIFNEKCGKENVKMSITSGAVNIRVASTKGWTQALTQYCKDQHPSAYEWEKFVERGEAVILLNKLQILMIQDGSMSDYDKVTCYKEMINVQAMSLKSGGWEYANSCWLKKYHFSLNESQKRRNLISNWHMEWSKIDSKHTIELANAREKMKRQRVALIGIIIRKKIA